MKFKAHPVSLGNHENVHYVAKNKEKSIIIKFVAFPELKLAFITKAKAKIELNPIIEDEIFESLKNSINVWDLDLHDIEIKWNAEKTTEDIIKEHSFLEKIIK